MKASMARMLKCLQGLHLLIMNEQNAANYAMNSSFDNGVKYLKQVSHSIFKNFPCISLAANCAFRYLKPILNIQSQVTILTWHSYNWYLIIFPCPLLMIAYEITQIISYPSRKYVHL